MRNRSVDTWHLVSFLNLKKMLLKFTFKYHNCYRIFVDILFMSKSWILSNASASIEILWLFLFNLLNMIKFVLIKFLIVNHTWVFVINLHGIWSVFLFIHGRIPFSLFYFVLFEILCWFLHIRLTCDLPISSSRHLVLVFSIH